MEQSYISNIPIKLEEGQSRESFPTKKLQNAFTIGILTFSTLFPIIFLQITK